MASNMNRESNMASKHFESRVEHGIEHESRVEHGIQGIDRCRACSKPLVIKVVIAQRASQTFSCSGTLSKGGDDLVRTSISNYCYYWYYCYYYDYYNYHYYHYYSSYYYYYAHVSNGADANALVTGAARCVTIADTPRLGVIYIYT